MKRALFLATVAVLSDSVTPAHAWGGYDPVEHPFDFIGQNQDQTYGDSVCQQRYGEKLAAADSNSGSWVINNQGVWVETGNQWKDFKAYDGVNIRNAWHVWYHQRRGHCVANKG
jgi:hypothetical protein